MSSKHFIIDKAVPLISLILFLFSAFLYWPGEVAGYEAVIRPDYYGLSSTYAPLLIVMSGVFWLCGLALLRGLSRKRLTQVMIVSLVFGALTTIGLIWIYFSTCFGILYSPCEGDPFPEGMLAFYVGVIGICYSALFAHPTSKK
jgi:drug/metabolite transporter (DMT)-like permease